MSPAQDAVVNAQPHDWTRARSIRRVAIGLLDRGIDYENPVEQPPRLGKKGFATITSHAPGENRDGGA